jgi:hypothetical protein
MPYKAKDLLHFTSATLNGGAVAVATADALHLVAYVGDGDGNGFYNGNDAVLITRVNVQVDSGFAAYPLVDPVIVADADGTGFIPSDAALQVNEAGVGLATSNLANPPIPPGVHFVPISNNVDPVLSVDREPWTVDRATVTVAVNIDDAHPAGSTGLIEGHLALTYDSRVFTVSAADVHLGSVLAQGDWNLVPTIDAARGQIAIAFAGTTPVASDQGGSLVIVDFHERGEPDAVSPRNPGSIALVSSVCPGGHYVETELEDAQGSFTVSLPVTPSKVTVAGGTGVAAKFGAHGAPFLAQAQSQHAVTAPTVFSVSMVSAARQSGLSLTAFDFGLAFSAGWSEPQNNQHYVMRFALKRRMVGGTSALSFRTS